MSETTPSIAEQAQALSRDFRAEERRHAAALARWQQRRDALQAACPHTRARTQYGACPRDNQEACPECGAVAPRLKGGAA